MGRGELGYWRDLKPEPLKELSTLPSALSRAMPGAVTPLTFIKSPAIKILPLLSITGVVQTPQRPSLPIVLTVPHVKEGGAKVGSIAPLARSRTNPPVVTPLKAVNRPPTKMVPSGF